jgi:hypothetical protein
MTSERSRSSSRRPFALPGCLLLAALVSAAASAQSGRHQPPPKAEAPVPTPTPEPTPIKRAPPEQIHVLFASSANAAISLSSYDTGIVADTFLQRLHDSRSLDVQTAARMTRDAARKRAKSETDRYVIWLELQYDNPSADTIGIQRPYPEDLRIQYIIYQPGSGATKANGNVYLRTLRTLPGVRTTPSCYPNSYYGLEGSLVVGAIEAADRVFDELSVPAPPLCP